MNTKVLRPVITETTALGAAYLAGLAVNFWPGIEALQEQWQVQQMFNPAMGEAERATLKQGWDKAVRLTISE